MTLVLYFHPLASFCHKVLMALYENETAFTGEVVDLMDEGSSATYLDMWPIGKIPLLHDTERNRTVPETTIIIEYLERHYPGPRVLLPKDEAACLDARLWDRFFDLYVQVPMQKVVTDRLRPDGEHDPRGVADACSTLTTAYGMIDRQLADKTWAIGETFSIADCAAAPALFYAMTVAPAAATHRNVAAYFERLLGRSSFKRVIDQARPYFHMFPFEEAIPARFLASR